MCGVKLGEHSKDVESLSREIKERVIDAGYNFVYIRTKHGEKVPQKVFFQWAKTLSENKIYRNMEPVPIWEIRGNKICVPLSPKVVYEMQARLEYRN